MISQESQIDTTWMADVLRHASAHENIKKFSKLLAQKALFSNVLFFSINLEKTSLNAKYLLHGTLPNTTSVSVDDTGNPVCYSLFFGGNYEVDRVEKFPAYSSYHALLSSVVPSQYGYFMPIHVDNAPYGVFLFFSKTRQKASELFSAMQPYINLFTEVHSATLSHQRLQYENTALRQSHKKIPEESLKRRAHEALESLWGGQSLKTDRFRREVIRAMFSSLHTTLVGESGTEKKAIANFLHQFSLRHAQTCIFVDCDNFSKPADLEIELFGKRPNKAHPTKRNYIGAFERAAQGTIVLLNIHGLFPSIQKKLAKVLQDKIFQPIGSNHRVSFEGKFICTAPSNFFDAYPTFYPALVTLLKQCVISFVSLEENKQDIAVLANHFLAKYRAKHGKEIRELSHPAVQALQQLKYDKNISTLRQLIYAACKKVTFGNTMMPDDIHKAYRAIQTVSENETGHGLQPMLQHYEIKLIRKAIAACGGNITQAAKRLDVPRRTLTYKCKNLKIGKRYGQTF